MATSTTEYAVRRNPEMGPGGTPVPSPTEPFDAPEPELGSETMLVNVGPQHPATHGVLRLVVELDGETVVSVTPRLGYLHSSFEKLGEYRTWNPDRHADRPHGLPGAADLQLRHVMAVEKLMGIEVTDRCRVARVICMEMDRIFSHLLWLGTWAIDVGAFTPFLYAFQQREKVYTLHEALTGARITTSATRIGGMMADCPRGGRRGCGSSPTIFPPPWTRSTRCSPATRSTSGARRGSGRFPRRRRVNHGLTGANLRASGVPYDVRKDRPYYDYESYDFEVPIGCHGDCYDRYLVRMEEMRQSIRILHQALDRLPDGPMDVEDPRVSLPSKTDCMSDMESRSTTSSSSPTGSGARRGLLVLGGGVKGGAGDVRGGGWGTQAGAVADPAPRRS